MRGLLTKEKMKTGGIFFTSYALSSSEMEGSLPHSASNKQETHLSGYRCCQSSLVQKKPVTLKKPVVNFATQESNSGPAFLCSYLQKRARRFGVGVRGIERVLKGRLRIYSG